jgi:hypothetical protein
VWTKAVLDAKVKAGKLRGYTELGQAAPGKKRSKYGNVKTTVDGLTFDSRKEAKRWGELKLLLKKGEIGLLERQRVFRLEVNGSAVAEYKSDFSYLTAGGVLVVEDVKSAATRKIATYRLKKKLMKAQYGIDIKEV